MKLPVSELKDLALVVANVFKSFDVKTMFFHPSNQVPFTNYNNLALELPKDLKKPFGSQAVLESFAKSLGYNTYKGLLADQIEFVDLKKNALHALNPNPLNKLYTEIWDALTANLMKEVLTERTIESKVIGNFKKSVLAQYSPFTVLKGSIIGDVEISERGKVSIPRSSVLNRALAHTVLLLAIEKFLKENGFSLELNEDDIQKIRALDSKDITTVQVDLGEILARYEYAESEYDDLTTTIRSTLAESFNVDTVFFVDAKTSPQVISIKIEIGLVKSFANASLNRAIFDALQNTLTKLFAENKADTLLYTHKEWKDGIAEYYGRNIFREVIYTIANEENNLKGKNFRGELVPYGTKTYWLNLAHGLSSFNFIHQYLVKLPVSVEKIEDDIKSYINKNLKPFDKTTLPKIRDPKSFSYQTVYSLQGNWNFDKEPCPEYITVVSDDFYSRDYHALYVQAELARILGNSADIYDKKIGKPNLFEIVPDRSYNSIETKVSIKPFKSKEPKGTIVEFNPLHLIHDLKIYFIEEENSDEINLFKESDKDGIAIFNIGMTLIDLPFTLRGKRDWVDEFAELNFEVIIDQKTLEIVEVSYNQQFEDTEIITSLKDTEPYYLADNLFEFKVIWNLVNRYIVQFYRMNKEVAERAFSDTFIGNGFVIYPSTDARYGKSIEEMITEFEPI